MNARRHTASLFAACLAFVPILGCEPSAATRNLDVGAHIHITPPSVDHPLGPESDHRHHFGSAVGRPNLRLTHEYLIKNRSSKPVKILRSVNAKPCCGDVESIGPKSLAPGESIALKVTLRLGETSGPLQHRALVETDLPGETLLEYWTTADILARVRVEEKTEKFDPLLPGQSARREFVAFAYGTTADPPVRLDDSTLKATSGVVWAGPVSERELEGQIIERSRPFTIELKAEGEPGSRIENISLADGKEILWRQQIQ